VLFPDANAANPTGSLNPGHAPTSAEAISACILQERSRRRTIIPFSEQHAVACSRESKFGSDTLEVEAPPGYSIRGPVQKASDFKNGQVGSIIYTGQDRIASASVKLECNVILLPAVEGYARATLSGEFERLLTKDDESEISLICGAPAATPR
jgi:hypothetical protein